MHNVKADEMAQWLKVLDPSVYTRQLTITSNPSTSGSDTFFWPVYTLTFMCTYPHMYTHIDL